MEYVVLMSMRISDADSKHRGLFLPDDLEEFPQALQDKQAPRARRRQIACRLAHAMTWRQITPDAPSEAFYPKQLISGDRADKNKAPTQLLPLPVTKQFRYHRTLCRFGL